MKLLPIGRLTLFLLALPVFGLAQQFPVNNQKVVQGVGTTAQGITSYSSAPPSVNPTSATWRHVTSIHMDTVAQINYLYKRPRWYPISTVRRSTPPPATSTSGSVTIDYTESLWQNTADSLTYYYEEENGCWQPVGTYLSSTTPVDVAATGSTGAICYGYGLWYDPDIDSIYAQQGTTWTAIGAGGGTTVTASNGLTKTGNDIALGGTLTGTTTITGASQDFTETGLKYYNFEADSAIWRINGEKFIHMGSTFGATYTRDELAVGYRAGANLPTFGSIANTLFGSYAGESLNGIFQNGASNAFFGYTAGQDITTGSYNSFFGVAAGAGTAATSSFNGGFGHHALIYSTGDYNYAFGNNSLANVTGIGNVAMGYNAITTATSAASNVGLGYASMEYTTTGDENVGIGAVTVRLNTTGSYNTGVGTWSLYSGLTASGNVGIGYKSGYNETGSNKLYIENTDSASPLIGGDFSNNYVGINQAVASLAYVLDINSTGAMRFPRGTTAQRPSTAAGIFRVNSDSTRFEWYTGSVWKSFSHVGDVAGGGSGTVTSVGIALPSIFSVSGSPVTTSGTLTGTLATQTANTIFAGPTTGSAAAPTFRTMVEADLPTYDAGRVMFTDASGKPTEDAGFTRNASNGGILISGTGGGTTPVIEVRNPSGAIAYLNITDNTTGAGATNGMLFGYNGGALVYNRENTPMYIATNDLTRITINSGSGVGSGFVSIGKGTGTGNRLLDVQQPTAITNATNYSLRVGHVTSGTAAAGFGVGTEYEIEDGSGNLVIGASEESVVTTATAGSVSADLVWKTRRSGTLTEGLRSLGNGTLQVATLSGTATQLMGATAANILCPITLGTGLSFSSGTLNGAFLPLTLTGATEVNTAGQNLYIRDAGAYPYTFMNSNYWIAVSDVNTYMDVGSTSGTLTGNSATRTYFASAGSAEMQAATELRLDGDSLVLDGLYPVGNPTDSVLVRDGATGRVNLRAQLSEGAGIDISTGGVVSALQSFFNDYDATITLTGVTATPDTIDADSNVKSNDWGYNPTTNTYTYNGPTGRYYSVSVSAQMEDVSGNSETLKIAVYRNGTITSAVAQAYNAGASNNPVAMHGQAILLLSNGDTINAKVSSTSGAGDDFDLVNYSLIIKEI